MHASTFMSLLVLQPLLAWSSAAMASGPAATATSDGTCLFANAYHHAQDYGCVAAHFDRYLSQAKVGDATAADILFYALSGCSPAELTKTQSAASSLSADHATVAQPMPLRRALARVTARCAHFSADQIAEQETVASLAAAHSNGDALWHRYSHVLANVHAQTPGSEQAAAVLVAQLKAHANAAHETNLVLLGRIYEEGVLAPADATLAYAYQAAAIEAAGDRAQASTNRMMRGLDRLEPVLSPVEKRKALSIAAQLLGKMDPQG